MSALAEYENALGVLTQVLASVRQRFLNERLAPEADLDLAGSPAQETLYRPSGRVVGPCDERPSCGVSAEFQASRAMFGLFPDSYLMAEQLGLTQLELCYTQVQWVERRSTPSEVTARAMAEYFGKLSFELVGFATGERNDLFVHKLTDLEEHLYLYGENAPEVLDEGCPEARVGTRVVSSLPEGGLQLVPRRLTYMTAARETPSSLFASSWDQGPEWRDWFVTGRGVEQTLQADQSYDEVLLAERMRELSSQLGTLLYAAMQAQSTGSDWEEVAAVTAASYKLEQALTVVRHLARIYTPQWLEQDTRWRSAIYGNGGLLGSSGIARSYTRVSARELLNEATQVLERTKKDLDDLLFESAAPQYPSFVLDALLDLSALKASQTTSR